MPFKVSTMKKEVYTHAVLSFLNDVYGLQLDSVKGVQTIGVCGCFANFLSTIAITVVDNEVTITAMDGNLVTIFGSAPGRTQAHACDQDSEPTESNDSQIGGSDTLFELYMHSIS
jgi:hypothetical protein